MITYVAGICDPLQDKLNRTHASHRIYKSWNW